MNEYTVLNRWLYERLQRMFSPVTVASIGVGMIGSNMPNIHSSRRSRYQMAIAGEYYRMNCPFCVHQCGRADAGQRLWIHHRYGVGLKGEDSDDFFWAAHCYNEHCMEIPAYRKQLRTDIFNVISRDERKQLVVQRGVVYDGELYKTEYPGVCVALDALPHDHHANIYLRQKNMDPIDLAQHHGVRWCQEAPPQTVHRSIGIVHNRIVFPIFMHGEMVGWQARYIGEADWKRIPKYFTQPGCHVNNMLYGFDDALGMPFVIVCEGPTDVIAMGAGAVATFGKKSSMSMIHYNLLVKNWPVIILLQDAEAYHASEMLYEQMRQVKPVVWVQLPDGLDPAEAVQQDREGVWDLIVRTALSQGIALTDGRPVCV